METNLPDLLGPQCFEACLGIEFRVQMNDDADEGGENPVASEAAELHLWQLMLASKAAPFSAQVPPLTRSLLPHLHLW